MVEGVCVVNLRTPQVSLYMFAKGMADRELEILAPTQSGEAESMGGGLVYVGACVGEHSR